MTRTANLVIAGACAAASALSMSFANAQSIQVVRNDRTIVYEQNAPSPSRHVKLVEQRNVVLPEIAPIPTPRPVAAKQARLGEARGDVRAAAEAFRQAHEPVAISVEPEPIPEERLSVRVVGPRFLPDRSEMLKAEADYSGRVLATAESALAWAVSSVTSSVLGTAVAADEPKQAEEGGDVVASAE